MSAGKSAACRFRCHFTAQDSEPLKREFLLRNRADTLLPLLRIETCGHPLPRFLRLGAIALIALTWSACSDTPREELIGDFSGSGIEVLLDQIDDELFYAEILVGTETFQTNATFDGGRLNGALGAIGQDPFTIAAGPGADEIVYSIGGQSFRLTRPGSARNEARAPETAPTPGPQSAPETPATDRDPRLVGLWARQEMMSGSQGSIVTQIFLQISPDGAFVEQMGGTLGGGSDWSMQIGDSGAGERGEWRTAGGVLMLRLPESGWVPLARYVFEPDRLLLIYGDQSQHLWFRQ